MKFKHLIKDFLTSQFKGDVSNQKGKYDSLKELSNLLLKVSLKALDKNMTYWHVNHNLIYN